MLPLTPVRGTGLDTPVRKRSAMADKENAAVKWTETDENDRRRQLDNDDEMEGPPSTRILAHRHPSSSGGSRMSSQSESNHNQVLTSAHVPSGQGPVMNNRSGSWDEASHPTQGLNTPARVRGVRHSPSPDDVNSSLDESRRDSLSPRPAGNSGDVPLQQQFLSPSFYQSAPANNWQSASNNANIPGYPLTARAQVHPLQQSPYPVQPQPNVNSLGSVASNPLGGAPPAKPDPAAQYVADDHVSMIVHSKTPNNYTGPSASSSSADMLVKASRYMYQSKTAPANLTQEHVNTHTLV